jgi:hypothetical protein
LDAGRLDDDEGIHPERLGGELVLVLELRIGRKRRPRAILDPQFKVNYLFFRNF